MANAIYWDTSALIMHYASEPGSSDYLRLLIQQLEYLAISFLHRVELYFALWGKESRGEIAGGSAKRLFQLFEQHVTAGRYYLVPWGEDVASESRQLLDESLNATPPVMLRCPARCHQRNFRDRRHRTERRGLRVAGRS